MQTSFFIANKLIFWVRNFDVVIIALTSVAASCSHRCCTLRETELISTGGREEEYSRFELQQKLVKFAETVQDRSTVIVLEAS